MKKVESYSEVKKVYGKYGVDRYVDPIVYPGVLLISLEK